MLIAPATAQKPSSEFVGKKSPAFSGCDHLLCQKRVLNSEDLIQSRSSSTYVKAHLCSALESLLQNCLLKLLREENSKEEDGSFFRKAASESKKEHTRSLSDPKAAGDIYIGGRGCSAWGIDSDAVQRSKASFKGEG